MFELWVPPEKQRQESFVDPMQNFRGSCFCPEVVVLRVRVARPNGHVDAKPAAQMPLAKVGSTGFAESVCRIRRVPKAMSSLVAPNQYSQSVGS